MALVLATVFWLQRVGDVGRRLDARSQPSEYAWPAQVAMSLIGVSFALAAAYALFALDLADERPGLVSTPPSVLLVAAFSGVALEIVFRGVIQPELVALFGWSGVVLTSLVYAALFIGSGWFLVVLALGTGLVWGSFSALTRKVSGVAGSHALFAMTWAALF
jgi:membrane protease YdiL (CAAX protease family)